MHDQIPEDEIFQSWRNQEGSSGPNAEFREDLLRQTTGVVRRRRRIKQCKRYSAFLLCFLAGMGAMKFAGTPKQEVAPQQPIHVAQEPVEEKHAVASVDEVLVSTEPDVEIPLLVLERLASAARSKQKVALYRQAGDRYLQERNDVDAALRCYRKALDAGDEADRTVQVQDSWLLIALKNARQEKPENVRHGS